MNAYKKSIEGQGCSPRLGPVGQKKVYEGFGPESLLLIEDV